MRSPAWAPAGSVAEPSSGVLPAFALGLPWRIRQTTATPVTNMARVASMNGAPRIAPIPTASELAPAPKTIATSGIIVSGRAVPDRGEDRADRSLAQAETGGPAIRPRW